MGLKYQQAVNGVINYCPFCVERKNWRTLVH